MKKVLLTTLAIAVALSGFAQKKGQERVKAEKPRCATAEVTAFGKNLDEAPAFNYAPTTSAPRNIKGDDYGGWQTMMTHYDLQTNKLLGNRMYRFNDGTLGVTMTWGQNTNNFPDRGTGYDYYDGSAFLYEEEGTPVSAAVESTRTGWPSYTQYGPDGEFLISHTGTSLVYYTREKKGEGEWQGPYDIPNPDFLGAPSYELTWPRVVTTGPNHDILHVVSAASDDDVYLYYSRSTDGETWTTTFMPTLEDSELTLYSADSYVMAANGNTVAIMLLSISGHGYIIKSTDNGETWTKTKFWDNPYAGDWETDESTLFGSTDEVTIDDTEQYGPELGNICIDDNGMVHAAFSGIKYAHVELGGSYTYWYGRTLDGIFYWNENMGTMQGPEWTCPDDGTVIPSSPHNICRMWWPTDATEEYITRNWESANLIGFVTPDDNFANIESDNMDTYFHSPASMPTICVDNNGTVAVAYSVIDPTRELSSTGSKYMRSIMVAFIESDYVMGDATGEYTDIPGNCYYEYVKLQDTDEFMHSYDEAVYAICPTNTADGEFWFGYQADDIPGLYSGSSDDTQTAPTDNYLWVHKVVPDYPGLNIDERPAVNPMTTTRVYPNPATDQLNIEVNASQASEMTIGVYNIMGQNVMNQTMSITTGMNTKPIDISELNSGIYFVTVKANGFENTMKFIVK